MKVRLLFISFIIITTANGQQTKLGGEVSIHNSETLTGRRQYVVNAQVEDVFRKAQSKVTDSRGQFVLTFVGVKENESVEIDVKKLGLQIVSPPKLSGVAGQEEMLKISMATPDSITEYRRRIYNIGKTQAEMRLEQRLNKRNKELIELKKNVARNSNRIAELEKELGEVQEERERIDETARDLASKYSPVNLDDASPLFKSAFVLFQRGNLDSALIILQAIDMNNKVNEAVRAGKILDSLQQDLHTRTKEIADVLHLKADLHKMNYDFDSASYCFQLLIKLDSSNIDYLIDYGNFLDWLNKHDVAMTVYVKALKICNNKYAGDSLKYNPYVARAQNNIGILYLDRNNLLQAESALTEALIIRKHHAITNPQAYEAYVANTENNLGMLYLKKREFLKAKKSFFDALIIRQKLVLKNSQAYEPDFASTLNNIGVLYSNMKNEADSAFFFLTSALQTYKRLALSNAKVFSVDEARIYNNIGVLYYNRKDYSKADTAFQKALVIRKQLASLNSQSYEPDLAVTQNNIGSLYSDIKEYSKADTAFQQALEIRKRLAKLSPDIYEGDVAQTLNNLGILYRRKNEVTNAIKAYREALTIRKRLAEINPEINQPLVANIQTNLGILYYKTSKVDDALVAFERAHAIYKLLFSSDPQIYEPDVANALCNLAVIYLSQGNKDRAKDAYKDALKIYQHLAVDSADAYSKLVEETKTKLEKIR